MTQEKSCYTCKHKEVDGDIKPCKSCVAHRSLENGDNWKRIKWEPSAVMRGIDTGQKTATESHSDRRERALRHNAGKPPLYYLLTFPEAVNGVARVSAYGEAKYARFNYLKGAPASESISCLLRHLNKWWNGETVDPESGLNHLDAVAWNALRLCDELQRRPELDDRPEPMATKPQAAEEETTG